MSGHRWVVSAVGSGRHGEQDNSALPVEDRGNKSGLSLGSLKNQEKMKMLRGKCGVCDTPFTKVFSRVAYERGVVIITCPGCQAKHLIADNLGWFGEERNIEEILRKKGGNWTNVEVV